MLLAVRSKQTQIRMITVRRQFHSSTCRVPPLRRERVSQMEKLKEKKKRSRMGKGQKKENKGAKIKEKEEG